MGCCWLLLLLVVGGLSGVLWIGGLIAVVFVCVVLVGWFMGFAVLLAALLNWCVLCCGMLIVVAIGCGYCAGFWFWVALLIALWWLFTCWLGLAGFNGCMLFVCGSG